MGYYNELSMDDPNAELFSDEGWSIADRPVTRRFSTITVKATRSYERTITVFADSTVELVKHDPFDSAQTWMALLVDGRHYNMAMWKHTIGRPELTEALDQALATVQAAITALQEAR